MRIAIISSPRSGNTWLRCILRDSFDLQEVSVHNYLDVTAIPDRCVLQLHWYREPNFQDFIAKNSFNVVSLARHPLDLLISVLRFVKFEPETARWLGGNCAIPNYLSGQSPASDKFLEYALSFGAENLLSITYQWWQDNKTIKLRYEDIIANTALEIDDLARRLNVQIEGLSDALEANSLEKFKALPNRHGWQGRSGLWRELIPFKSAQSIYMRHRRVFENLGYAIEPNALTREGAEANWKKLVQED